MAIDKKILDDLFYIYLVAATSLTVLFLVAKCLFDFTLFDRFVYISDESLLEYVISHVVVYFILGVIFGGTNLGMFMIKTVVVEFALVYVHKCSFDGMPVDSAIYSIVIGVISFMVGVYVKNMKIR